MPAKRSLKSAYAFAQSDQSLCCPHDKTLRPWLSKMRLVKILIRLRESAGWSESSLGAHIRTYVFWHWLIWLLDNKRFYKHKVIINKSVFYKVSFDNQRNLLSNHDMSQVRQGNVYFNHIIRTIVQHNSFLLKIRFYILWCWGWGWG